MQPFLLRVQLQPEGAIATITIESAIATGSAIAAPSRQNSVPRKPRPTRSQLRSGQRLSRSGEAAPPRLRVWRSSGSPRPAVEVETACATEECALGGQGVGLCRCPTEHLASLATQPLGWRLLPPTETPPYCEWRAELMRGAKRETLGPNMRP